MAAEDQLVVELAALEWVLWFNHYQLKTPLDCMLQADFEGQTFDNALVRPQLPD